MIVHYYYTNTITYKIENIHTTTTSVVARFELSWSGARLSVWRRLFRFRFFFAFSPLDCPSPFQPQSWLLLHSPLIAPPLGIWRSRVHAPRPSFWGFRSVARVTFSGWLSMRQTITRLTPLSRHLHNKLAAARCIYINVYTSIHIHKYIILAKHVKCITHNNIWFSYSELANIYTILCIYIYIYILYSNDYEYYYRV